MFDTEEYLNPVYFLTEKSPIYSCTFLQNAKYDHLLCGTGAGQVTFWSARTQRVDDSYSLHSGDILCMNICICRNKVITQDKSGLVKTWIESGTWNVTASVKLNYFGFCKISVSDSNGGIIACPSENSEVQIRDIDLKVLKIIKPYDDEHTLGKVMACLLTEIQGRIHVFVAYENSSIILWDYNTNEVVSKLKLTTGMPITLDYDESGKQGVCGCTSKKVPIFKFDDTCNLSIVQCIKLKNEGVGSVKINRSLDILIIGCWDGGIRIFSWKTLKLLKILQFHSGSIEHLCFSKEECESFSTKSVMVAGSTDSKITVWCLSDILLK